MAHKYDNFDDAFDALIPYWDSASTYYASGSTAQGNALMAWIMGDDHAAIGHLCTAVHWSLQATKALARLDETASDQSELMESVYWSATGDGPAEVTMDSMLLAMLTAKDDELKRFIGLVDAFRASLWDKPFNSEFYAALVRGFKG